jgi:hypothetical protein
MDTSENKQQELPLQQQQQQQQRQHFYVYLLESSCKHATYVGATTDPDRRLRQHNKELAGGAVATGTRIIYLPLPTVFSKCKCILCIAYRGLPGYPLQTWVG